MKRADDREITVARNARGANESSRESCWPAGNRTSMGRELKLGDARAANRREMISLLEPISPDLLDQLARGSTRERERERERERGRERECTRPVDASSIVPAENNPENRQGRNSRESFATSNVGILGNGVLFVNEGRLVSPSFVRSSPRSFYNIAPRISLYPSRLDLQPLLYANATLKISSLSPPPPSPIQRHATRAL